MTETVLEIKRWGRGLGLRLPAAIARKANLRLGQRVRLTAEDARVVITPGTAAPLTLEQRLARFDFTRHGGEAMAGRPTSAEGR